MIYDGDDDCSARFLEHLVRTELVFVRMTPPWTLKRFLVNATRNFQKSVNAAMKLFELTATHKGIPGIGKELLPSTSKHKERIFFSCLSVAKCLD